MAPLTDKTQQNVQDGIWSLHGPAEDGSKLVFRSDYAGEITSAVEQQGGFSMPVVPHRANSSRAERAISTIISNLLRVHFLRSGLAPCFRPMLAIVVVQLWNLFRLVQRLDVDGNCFFSSLHKIRHGQRSVAIDPTRCRMPGQLVTCAGVGASGGLAAVGT